MIYTFGDVQMTQAEHKVLADMVRRGMCPYCGRTGLSDRYGAQWKHMRACKRKLTLLEREKAFAKWINAEVQP